MLALGRNRYRILLFGWIALAVTATTLVLEPVRAQQNKSELDREAKITATKPQLKAFTLMQPFVVHIQAQRDVKVRALVRGRLAEIAVKEGQHVKEGDVLFKTIIPTPTPFRTNGQWFWIIPVGFQTKGQPTRAGSKFDIYKAPFDGTVGRLQHKPGSMVEEGEILTTLSDDSVMQVYFKVTKEQFLDVVAEHMRSLDQRQVELVLSEGKNYDQIGKMAKIEHDFNDEPRSFTFRADFSNPDRVLRHGQTCTVFIRQVPRDVLVIPQKATCEVRQKRYVYVIDHDDVAHQREVVIQYELGDLFVVRSGVSVDDKIVLDGIGQVLDGEKVDYEER